MTSQRFHIKDLLSADLAPRAYWPLCNRQCYLSFREWLRLNGCAKDTRQMYAVVAHLTLGILNKPHLEIDPSVDLERTREYILQHEPDSTIQTQYNNGLVKFGEYLSMRQRRAIRPRSIHWEYYLAGVPESFHAQVQEYVAHRQKGWRTEDRKRLAIGLISSLGQTLRKLMKSKPLKELSDITPQAWFNTLDEELGESYHPRTINARFSILKSFLRFVDEHGTQVCQRIFLVQPLKCGVRIPRDASVSDLRQLLEENQREMNVTHAGQRHIGVIANLRGAPPEAGGYQLRDTPHPHRAVQGAERPPDFYEFRHNFSPERLAGTARKLKKRIGTRFFVPSSAAHPALLPTSPADVRQTLWCEGHSAPVEA
jgi:hypothetical protein